MELNSDIKDFISSVELTTERELSYVKQNDWTLVLNKDAREEEYKLQDLLTSRALTNAKVLYTKAKEELSNPEVKKALNKFFEFLKIHGDRSDNYLMKTDWTSSELGVADKRDEIEFQSTVLSNLTKHKDSARKMNYGEETLVVSLPIYNDEPIPLIMADKIEERYPEVKIFLEKRKLEEKFVPLKIETEKQNSDGEKKPKKRKPRGGRRPGY